jgi:hypothetical protein
MNFRKTLGLLLCILIAVSSFAQMGRMGGMGGQRGKAELKISSGSITIDYGQPPLGARDLAKDIANLPPGKPWRMGMNQATVLTTPVDLTFGSTKIPKGSYSLWLSAKYELIFNSQTGQWGTMYDGTKDFASVPMKQGKLESSVDKFTIELKSAPGGGTIALSWGTLLLTSEFKTAQ